MVNKQKSNLLKQGAILAVAGLVVKFLGFLYRLPLANTLGTVGMGYYSLAFQIFSVLLIISSYGAPAALSKILIEKREQNKHEEAVILFRITTLVILGLCIVLSTVMWFWAEPIVTLISTKDSTMATYAVRSLAPTILLLGGLSLLRGYFQSFKTMVPTAISQVIEQVFNAVGSVVFARWLVKYGLNWGAAGGTIGTGFGAFFGLTFLLFVFMIYRSKRKMKESHLTNRWWDTQLFKEFIRVIVPISLLAAVSAIVSVIDTKMLYSSLSYVGYEEAAINGVNGAYNTTFLTLTNLPISVAIALAAASLPSISASYIRKDYELAKYKSNKVLKLTALIVVPAMIGLGVLAEPILGLIFSADFVQYSSYLKLGAPIVVTMSFVSITNTILQSMGHMKEPLKNMGIAGALKILTNTVLLFVFQMEGEGVIIATILFSVVMLILNVKSIYRETRVKFEWFKLLAKPCVAGVTMGIVSLIAWVNLKIILGEKLGCIVAILFGAFTYGVVILLVKGVDEEELRMLPMGNKLVKLLGITSE